MCSFRIIQTFQKDKAAAGCDAVVRTVYTSTENGRIGKLGDVLIRTIKTHPAESVVFTVWFCRRSLKRFPPA